MREGRRQRLGLQEGTEGTVEDTYLDRILEQEGPRTLALDPDAFVDTTDQRYVQDAYNYYLGGGLDDYTEGVDLETGQPDLTGGQMIDTGVGGGGQDLVTGGVDTTSDTSLTDFEQNLVDQGAGVEVEPGLVLPPAEMTTQEEIDAFNAPAILDSESTADEIMQDLNNQQAMLNPTGGNIMDEVALTGGIPDTNITAPSGDVFAVDDPLAAEKIDFAPEQQGLVDQAFSKVGSTASDIMNDLSQIPGAIADFANQTVDIFGKKINVGKTLLSAGINRIAGGPISLVFDALGAIGGMLPDGIAATTDKAREIGLIQGDNTVTQDIYGINTQSMFGDYNQYNIDRVEQLEDKVNKTPRDITELQQRKDYIKSSGADGNIAPAATPTDIATGNITGDASVAESVYANEEPIGDQGSTVNTETGNITDSSGNYAGNIMDEFEPAPAPAPAPAPSYNYSGGGGRDSGGGGSSSGGGGGGESGYGGFCFDPSTPIQMTDGSTKKIKDIQLGDDTKGGEVTGVFQFKASDEIHDYKGVTVAGSHYVKENGKFIMVKDSPLAVKIDKIPVVYSLDTSGRRIFIKDIEFADYNGDGIAKGFLHNAGVPLEGFDKEVLRQVQQRLI